MNHVRSWPRLMIQFWLLTRNHYAARAARTQYPIGLTRGNYPTATFGSRRPIIFPKCPHKQNLWTLAVPKLALPPHTPRQFSLTHEFTSRLSHPLLHGTRGNEPRGQGSAFEPRRHGRIARGAPQVPHRREAHQGRY